MATNTPAKEHLPAHHHKSRESKHDQGLNTASVDDVLMDRILEDLRITSQADLLKRIAILPDIRRGKVLSMCRRLGQESYLGDDQLNRAMDHLLEAIMT